MGSIGILFMFFFRTAVPFAAYRLNPQTSRGALVASDGALAGSVERRDRMETLPLETRARVRAVLAEVRGLHICVLFADGACELHCLSAASPPPVVLQHVSSAAFIPPALPNSAAVVACCAGHQLILALSAAPRSGFVCARSARLPCTPPSAQLEGLCLWLQRVQVWPARGARGGPC